MSGPKLVSVRVLDQRLQQIIALQSEIAESVAAAGAARYRDGTTGELVVGTNQLEHFERQIAEARKPFRLGCGEEVSRQVLSGLKDRIRERTEQLRTLRDEIAAAMGRFEQECADRDAAADLAVRFAAAAESFELHKRRTCEYLQELVDAAAMAEVSRTLDAVLWRARAPAFEAGLRDRVAEEEMRLARHQRELRDRVNAVRSAHDSDPRPAESSPATAEVGDSELSTACRGQLARLGDVALRRRLEERMETLPDDGYMWREFHDDVVRAVVEEARRRRLTRLVVEAESIQIPAGLTGARDTVVAALREAALAHRISDRHVSRAERTVDELRERVRAHLRRVFERQLVLTEVASGLESLGYQAVQADELVDFERREALWQTPDGDFVLVRCDGDGQLRYNFALSSDPAALSPAERSEKVHDMESACEQFRQVLRTLAERGVETALEALPAREQLLVTLPEQYRADPQTHAPQRRRRAAPLRRQNGGGDRR